MKPFFSKKSLFLFIFLASYFSCIAQKDSCKVLFIGNSLTYYNDMPSMLQRMFDNNQDKKYIVYSATLPGINLKDQLQLLQTNDTDERTDRRKIVLCKNTFNKVKFDFVVLQEVTTWMLIPEIRKYTFGYIEVLDSLIKINGGKTILYQNYAGATYPNSYCLPDPVKFKYNKDAFYCSEEFLNNEQVLAILVKGFAEISNKIGGKITPIGQAFDLLRKLNSNYDLLSDETHPSKVGSYLMASLFYQTITGNCFKNANGFPEIAKFQKLDIVEVCEELTKVK